MHLLPRLTLALTLLAVPAAHADGPPAPRSRLALSHWTDQARASFDRVRRAEAVEMVRAIAGGSQMGPGEGWFHPGEGRYGWKWLAARSDADKDRAVTRSEFRGPDDLFARLDRHHDGALTTDDFNWADTTTFARQAGFASAWFSQIDGGSNGRITADEWAAYFKRLAKDKGYLTPDDLREALTPPTPPRNAPAKKGGGPSPRVLLRGLIDGELGSVFEGPAIGDRAPNFTLPTHDGKARVRLADHRGKKPVVLIFGSFT